jgi:hypothetical protein
MGGLTQSGAGSFLDVTANNTTIRGGYALGLGTATVGNGRTLTVTSGDITNLSGAGVINVGAGGAAAHLTVGVNNISVDTLNLNNGIVDPTLTTVTTLTSAGTSSIDGALQINDTGSVTVTSGTLTLPTGPLSVENAGTKTALVTGAGTFNAIGGLALPASGVINKTGAGTLRIAGTQTNGLNSSLNATAGNVIINSDAGAFGSLNLNLSVSNTGTTATLGSTQHLKSLSVTNNAVATLAPVVGPTPPLHTAGDKYLNVGSLNIAGATSQLDLGNGTMIVEGGSNYSNVLSLVTSGLNGFAWDGPGINSSVAAADALATGLTGIAVVDNNELGYDSITGVDFTGSNGNVNIDSVLVKFTYYGDADLNGKLTLDDFNQWSFAFENALPANWLNGDFDYNGILTLDDFNMWSYGFEQTQLVGDVTLAPPPPGGGPVAVPEPSSIVLLVLGGLGLGWQARRRVIRRRHAA